MKSSFCIDLQRFMLIPTKFPLSRDYAEHQQQFDEIKHRHTLNEVGDVAESRYD